MGKVLDVVASLVVALLIVAIISALIVGLAAAVVVTWQTYGPWALVIPVSIPLVVWAVVRTGG